MRYLRSEGSLRGRHWSEGLVGHLETCWRRMQFIEYEMLEKCGIHLVRMPVEGEDCTVGDIRGVWSSL